MVTDTKLDKEGRIHIPKEIRLQFGLKQGKTVQLVTNETEIKIVTEPEPECAHCSSTDNLTAVGTKYICFNCINKAIETNLLKRQIINRR